MTISIKQKRLSEEKRTLKRIPTDAEINSALRELPECWQTVVARMALFGIRPHECWLGQIQADGTYMVHTGKTGRRIAVSFELKARTDWLKMALGPLPVVTAHENRDYGSRLNKVFSRAGINKDGGWSPYCLRHRWVALSAQLDVLDESVAAAAAGHSVATRQKVYKRLIGEQQVLGSAQRCGLTFDINDFIQQQITDDF